MDKKYCSVCIKMFQHEREYAGFGCSSEHNYHAACLQEFKDKMNFIKSSCPMCFYFTDPYRVNDNVMLISWLICVIVSIPLHHGNEEVSTSDYMMFVAFVISTVIFFSTFIYGAIIEFRNRKPKNILLNIQLNHGKKME